MKTVTNNPKGVEEVFCVPFSKLKQHHMDDELAEMFFTLCSANGMSIPDNGKPFIIQMTEKSLKHRFTFTIKEYSLLVFIAFMAKSPGNVIMYLTYLQYECKKRDIREMDWMTFSEIFAMGFPSDSDLHSIWDMQKVKPKENGDSDNLLDYAKAGQSIQF